MSCVNYYDAVASNIYSAFNVECSLGLMPKFISMSDKASYDFALCINTRDKIFKFYASVGSVNISSKSCELFSDILEPI